MTRRFILTATLLTAAPAFAQQPAPHPDLVLLPRATAEAALAWIATPNPVNAVRLYAELAACLADNPVNGRVARQARDHCPAVTAALAERHKAQDAP